MGTVGRYNIAGRDQWLVLGAATTGGLLFALSYFLPYWNFKLVAPQYPKGLFMTIFLSGVGGGVDEVDIINHYIGMHKLVDAAPMERALGPWLVAVLALSVVIGVLFAGKKLHWGLLIPAVALPLGFLGDTLYWMWSFGHDLDPSAPIDFSPFMPELFGHGQIGQFHTWAWPGAGFWLSVVGGVLVIGAVLLRERVCRRCPAAAVCGGTCSHHLVGLRETRP